MKQVFKAWLKHVSGKWQKKQKESSAKCTVKVSIEKELVNQNQILSKKGNNNSKSDFTPLQNPLQNSTPWFHSKTPLHDSTP